MPKKITGIGRSIGFLVSLSILMVACSEVDSGNTSAGLNSSLAWAVQFSVSGGFAGVRQRLEINQDGRVIAVDEKIDKTVIGKLGSQDFKQIQKLVVWRTATLSSSPEKPGGTDCFDCFIYTIESKLDGKKISKIYSGLNFVEENERHMIQVLSRVLREALNKTK